MVQIDSLAGPDTTYRTYSFRVCEMSVSSSRLFEIEFECLIQFETKALLEKCLFYFYFFHKK